MRRTWIFVASVAVLLVVVQMADSQQDAAEKPADAPTGVLDVLRVDQKVGLTPVGARYSISVNPQWRAADIYKIIKVQHDYLVLEDLNRSAEVRIPVCAIRDVITLKTGVRSPDPRTAP